ncbi:UNVERIFIED_CONTAM: Retrovirus-related Pol polyprotein from transposon TNT 1-94 [Sesamum radiatum]|uniref:Retrovirus-related Pol polyprotein from transposon TNT 1-94 n=1 Tax=Sesamum radiatum TaxID=300843 RepID=A0AAW2MD75_SESRA
MAMVFSQIYENIEEDKVIAKVEMESTRNFPLRLHHNAFKTKSADHSWIWHKRYRHLNFHGLKLLKEMKIVEGLPKVQINANPCENCIIEKQHRTPFPKGKSWRASALLELIHSNICGPMRTISLGPHRYFLTFTDDYARMTWVFFLKEKSEAFTIFKRFKALVEKQNDSSIKTMRSDRGDEYTSQEFEEYCKDEGIWKQLTSGYSPQQNGVAERKNKTFFEMARTIINEMGLPKTFWAIAVDTTIYILNRCPTKSERNKMPYEAWTRLKPSLSHFKVFGCICYVHIPAEKRTKFDEKSEKCIFIGYSSNTKGYRLLKLNTNKLIVSRDVTFHESTPWDWKEKKIHNLLFNPPPASHEENYEQNDLAPSTPKGGISNTNSESSSPESPLPQMRSLSEIYYTCRFMVSKSENYEEAAKEEVWRNAMKEELHMIENNYIWVLVDKPKYREVISLDWIYKIKLN